MDSDQESDESGLSFDIEDDSHNENESDIELTEEEDSISYALCLRQARFMIYLNSFHRKKFGTQRVNLYFGIIMKKSIII